MSADEVGMTDSAKTVFVSPKQLMNLSIIDKLKQKLSAAEKKIADLELTNEKMTDYISDLEEAKKFHQNQLSGANAFLQKKIAVLEEMISFQKDQLHSKTVGYSDALAAGQDQIIQLEEQLKAVLNPPPQGHNALHYKSKVIQLESTQKKLLAEIISLKAQLNEADTNAMVLADNNAQLSDQQLKAEINSLKYLLANGADGDPKTDDIIDSLKAQLHKKNTQITTLEYQIMYGTEGSISSDDIIDSLKAQLKEADTNAIVLAEKNNQLSDQLKYKDNKIVEWSEKNIQLNDQLKTVLNPPPKTAQWYEKQLTEMKQLAEIVKAASMGAPDPVEELSQQLAVCKKDFGEVLLYNLELTTKLKKKDEYILLQTEQIEELMNPDVDTDWTDDV